MTMPKPLLDTLKRKPILGARAPLGPQQGHTAPWATSRAPLGRFTPFVSSSTEGNRSAHIAAKFVGLPPELGDASAFQTDLEPLAIPIGQRVSPKKETALGVDAQNVGPQVPLRQTSQSPEAAEVQLQPWDGQSISPITEQPVTKESVAEQPVAEQPASQNGEISPTTHLLNQLPSLVQRRPLGRSLPPQKSFLFESETPQDSAQTEPLPTPSSSTPDISRLPVSPATEPSVTEPSVTEPSVTEIPVTETSATEAAQAGIPGELTVQRSRDDALVRGDSEGTASQAGVPPDVTSASNKVVQARSDEIPQTTVEPPAPESSASELSTPEPSTSEPSASELSTPEPSTSEPSLRLDVAEEPVVQARHHEGSVVPALPEHPQTFSPISQDGLPTPTISSTVGENIESSAGVEQAVQSEPSEGKPSPLARREIVTEAVPSTAISDVSSDLNSDDSLAHKPVNQLTPNSDDTVSPQTVSPQTVSPQTGSPQTGSPQTGSPQTDSPQTGLSKGKTPSIIPISPARLAPEAISRIADAPTTKPVTPQAPQAPCPTEMPDLPAPLSPFVQRREKGLAARSGRPLGQHSPLIESTSLTPIASENRPESERGPEKVSPRLDTPPPSLPQTQPEAYPIREQIARSLDRDSPVTAQLFSPESSPESAAPTEAQVALADWQTQFEQAPIQRRASSESWESESWEAESWESEDWGLESAIAPQASVSARLPETSTAAIASPLTQLSADIFAESTPKNVEPQQSNGQGQTQDDMLETLAVVMYSELREHLFRAHEANRGQAQFLPLWSPHWSALTLSQGSASNASQGGSQYNTIKKISNHHGPWPPKLHQLATAVRHQVESKLRQNIER